MGPVDRPLGSGFHIPRSGFCPLGSGFCWLGGVAGRGSRGKLVARCGAGGGFAGGEIRDEKIGVESWDI